jgi:hypothetical protein
MADIMPATNKIIFGILFFTERSLNFILINGILLTIRKLNKRIRAYKNH